MANFDSDQPSDSGRPGIATCCEGAADGADHDSDCVNDTLCCEDCHARADRVLRRLNVAQAPRLCDECHLDRVIAKRAGRADVTAMPEAQGILPTPGVAMFGTRTTGR
jgi:hypothetical protein